MPTGKSVTITLTDAKLSVTPYKVKIKSAGQEVVWNCADYPVEIFFKGVAPFAPGPKSHSVHSGEPTNATNTTYRYTIRIDLNGTPVTIDPEVAVDDGGGPGGRGGGRKSTRKSGRKSSRKSARGKKK